MSRWLRPSAYPVSVLLLLLALAATVFAWVTLDLARVAIANFELLRSHGLLAVMHGGLWQTAEVAAKGAVSLALYLLFKACEREVIHRWTGRD